MKKLGKIAGNANAKYKITHPTQQMIFQYIFT